MRNFSTKVSGESEHIFYVGKCTSENHVVCEIKWENTMLVYVSTATVISGKAPQCKAIRALPVLFRQ
jgi:hypothetical protein